MHEGKTHRCDTAQFPGLVLTPEGLDVGRVPAWCVDGRFVLAYSGDGAIHEGYSDIFGESLGFYYEDEGASADYLAGGDFEEGPIRSMIDPGFSGDPDAYRDRFEAERPVDGDRPGLDGPRIVRRRGERARHSPGDRCALLREVGRQRDPGSAIRQAVAVLLTQLPPVRRHGYPGHVQVALPMAVELREDADA